MTNTQRAVTARRKLTITMAGALAVGAVSVLSAPANAILVAMDPGTLVAVAGCTYTVSATTIDSSGPVNFYDNDTLLGTANPTTSPQTETVQWTPTTLGLHQIKVVDGISTWIVTPNVTDGSGLGSADVGSGTGSASLSGGSGSSGSADSPSGSLSGGGTTGGTTGTPNCSGGGFSLSS